jgi:DNA-binding SARP family transcriptional activator
MPNQFSLTLLREFGAYRDRQPLYLPRSCQRVLALVALKRRPLHRTWICETLWPDVQPKRAAARLRTALWLLRPLGAQSLLLVDSQFIALRGDVAVDYHQATDLLGRLLDDRRGVAADPDVVAGALAMLRTGELLDEWTDSWCAHDRSRYHATRMASHEVICGPSDRAGHGQRPRSSCRTRRRVDSKDSS